MIFVIGLLLVLVAVPLVFYWLKADPEWANGEPRANDPRLVIIGSLLCIGAALMLISMVMAAWRWLP